MNIQEALYPYQREDLEQLKAHPHYLNRNPMGLGKCVEALALCEGM